MVKKGGVMLRFVSLLVWAAFSLIGVVGCASVDKESRQRQVSSVVAYLFPGTNPAPVASDASAEIRVPFRLGVAFVPDNADPQFRLPESERLKLASKVQASFSSYPFLKEIVVVPSAYLEPGGGFANLERVAALLNLDVVALISFDQVQNAGAKGSSFLYWTGVGAYFVDGDQYDILTAIETSVFDIRSRRLLLRAGGISNIKGTSTMVGFSEQAREARTRGFDEALTEMMGKLHGEIKSFRERAPQDPKIRLIVPPGYKHD